MKKRKFISRKSSLLRHESPQALYQLARDFHAKGKLDDALASYRRAIELNPKFAAAYHAAGNVHQAKRQLDDAMKCFQKAVDLQPDIAVSYNNLANVLLEKGEFEHAIVNYEKALWLQPDSPATGKNLAVAYFGLGHSLAEQGQRDNAINAYRKALQRNPQLQEAYYALGMLFLQREQFAEALACYEKLLELDPENARGYGAMGTVLQKMGRSDEAEAYYRKALHANPALPEAFNNLGTIYRDKGLMEDAMACYQKALQARRDFPEAYNNLGTVYRDRGHIDVAVSHYRRAIDLKADFAEAHWNLAFSYLLSGDFSNGWREYEWRWKLQDHYLHNLTQPLWDGADIAGKTILLHAEQGIGDTIQFIRYAPLVAQRGAKVIIACQKEIAKLLRHVEGVDTVVAYGDPLPDLELHCPLLRLPLIFQTTLESIPAAMRYLNADPVLVDAWSEKINKTGVAVRIGLAWAGRPTHANDRNRSLPFDLFAPLFRLDNVALFSLQKGEASLEAKSLSAGMQFVDFTDEFADFSDTAALIENLDLIISVDTAVAHLAGAMGKPTWTLLPFAPDWRWMLNRSDSQWYPSMRLFRQPSPGDWLPVIEQIVISLERARRGQDF